MTYAIIEKNQPVAYPCYAGDISIVHGVEINSETWDGGILDGIQYVKVKEVRLPSDDIPEWHYWEYELPEYVSGEWVQKWVLKKFSDEFIAQQEEQAKKADGLIKYMLEAGFDEDDVRSAVKSLKVGPAQKIIFTQPPVQGLTDL